MKEKNIGKKEKKKERSCNVLQKRKEKECRDHKKARKKERKTVIMCIERRCPWCNGIVAGNGHGDTSSNLGRD